MMNQLSTMGYLIPPFGSNGLEQKHNLITISAGDSTAPLATVFQGTIYNAYADLSGAPDVPFVMTASGGGIESIKPVNPTSFAGTVDAATVMQTIAGLMNAQFQNNGVSVKLSNPYYPGTAWTQAETCAVAANIEWTLDNGMLSIWPAGGSNGGSVPEINPQNGLRGYPKYNQLGVEFSALFNPAVHFGGRVKLTSSLTPACGTWYVYGLSYNLASIVPDGPWFMEVLGARIPGVVSS